MAACNAACESLPDFALLLGGVTAGVTGVGVTGGGNCKFADVSLPADPGASDLVFAAETRTGIREPGDGRRTE